MGKVLSKKVSLFLLLTAALVFAFATGAVAERRTFGPISLDVPKGWQIEEDDNQLTFTAPDDSAVLTFIAEEIEETTVKDFAKAVAEELEGTKPVASDGGFEFTFESEDGLECNVFVMGIEGTDTYLVIIMAGEHPELENLLDSFELLI